MSINSISMKNYRMCQNSSNPYRYRNSTLLVPKNLNIESNSTLVDTNQTSKNITQPRLSLQPQQDSVSFSSREKIVAKEEKKGLSTGAKWGIVIAETLGMLITIELLMYKHEHKRLTRLFNKKLTISNLPENIQFQEAKTLDEALKFAKETLGIKHIDKDFTLEMLNYVNEGIVNVSNANKGKIFVPKKLFIDKNKNSDGIAFTVRDINSKAFGTLGLNSEFFTHEGLNKKIIEKFKIKDKNTETAKVVNNIEKNTKEKLIDKFNPSLTEETTTLLNKFKENPESISLKEKIQIMQRVNTARNMCNADIELITKHPIEWLKKYSDTFKEQKIDIDFDKLKTLSKESQLEEVYKLIDNNTPGISCYGSDSAYHALYHEMGHLQDYAKNLENLQKEELKALNFINTFKKKFSFNQIQDHWGGSTYETEKKLMEKSPKEFEKLYPNLYKHLNNPEYQRIASYSGGYAMTGIGEFIAETYALLLSGKELPKEVIELYKKYKGPLLPGM